jgi:signal transduction histidine kinase
MNLTRIEALKLLFVDSAHDRFRAARALESLAEKVDLAVLHKAQYLEKDSYVQKRIDRAIQNCAQNTQAILSETVPSDDIAEIIKAQRAAAINWFSGLLLHEVGAKIGLIDLYAQEEIPNYETSKTKRNVLYLKEIFEGIEHLRSASATPRLEEFALDTLLEEVIVMESADKIASISRVGEKPAIVTGDPRLLRLAICNGLRNGIEAALAAREMLIDNGYAANTAGRPDVIVSWGTTDTDYWVTVIDHGQGIVGNDQVFDIGTSTKAGHVGFGLAIAKQATESVGGELKLFASPGGGATYELRWKRKI